MGCGDVAAAIHANMCNDDRFGYSWDERHGGPSTVTWNVGGRARTLTVGDYDCSSSTIDAWRSALEGTAYEGALDAATYTGNMRSVFVGSGLFEWKPMSFLAHPGDLYLNEGKHVAMCQTQTPDVLSEFCINEKGGVYGGQRGDQTGREAYVHGYYDRPWDGILHYNGKADSSAKGGTEMPTAIASPVGAKPVYRLYYPKSGEHFYTTDANERSVLVSRRGWQPEGVAWTTPAQGAKPVYRLYNGLHLWTADYNEACVLVGRHGWTCEGVQFWAAESGAPVYRLSHKSGQHLWTADANERDALTSRHGWKSEGVAWYV